jgi:hypothetical protein
MGFTCVIFLVCSLRTNVIFVIIFMLLIPIFGLNTAAYWYLAMDYTGNAAYVAKLLQVWYRDSSMMAAKVTLTSNRLLERVRSWLVWRAGTSCSPSSFRRWTFRSSCLLGT